MADSFCPFLLENLTPFLNQESKFLGGAEDQLRFLQNELSLINAFLQDTERYQHDNELVKRVVRKIKGVSYDVEDVIDTFIITTVTKHRIRSKLKRLIHSSDRAISFHGVSNEIEGITNVIEEIYDKRSKYGAKIAESSGGDAETKEILSRRRRYVEEDQVVGFDHDTKVLVKQLIEGSLQRNVVYGTEIAESSGGDAEAEEILHRRRKHVEEDQVVGFAHDAEVLVKGLMEGSLQRNVVSIIGMGGLGKTTLARKIYNNNDVKNSFDFRGWVYVSQKHRIRELLLEILKGLTPLPRVMLRAELKEKLLHGLYAMYSSNNDKLRGILTEDFKRFKEMNERFKGMNDEEFRKAWSEFLEGVQDHNDLKNSLSNFVQDFYSENGVKFKDMTEDELKSVLLESLKDKRYLLVIDDIWDNEVWNEVSTAFPNNSNRSRILITTRIKEVSLHASSVNNSVPPILSYDLPLLDEDKSWELFSKKVFWDGTCLPELETLGRQLVKSCHGLPLAIVVLGGLLACKEKTLRTWSKYVGHVNLYLTEDRSCRDILALSYNNLSQRLKPCFLYFGIYPEDFEIPVRQLIRLWIAEGFIWQIGNRNIEDVAEGYLEELIDRSLIQVATKRLDGGVKTCRIHELLRGLCISESSEEKFLEVHSDGYLSPIGKSRRISIHNGNNPYIYSSPSEPSNCRSIIGFRGVVEHECPVDKSYLKWICKSNKLVRVVELSNMGICCLISKGIEKLVLLRYLSISSGELHVIPNSICNLWNLETLDMRNSTVKTKCLPKGIWKLQRLRHLYLDGPTSLPRTKKNTVALPNLQVLTGIAINKDTESHFANARFPNLRKLGLYSSRGVESGILSSLHPLCHLQTLKIYQLYEFSSPTSISLTLTKITLVDSDLSPAIMKVLGSLTKLRILKVRGATNIIANDILNCYARSFQQLEVFKMSHLNVLEWHMGQGAMPNLQCLVIESCRFLVMLPHELLCLRALPDVEVLHPNPDLAKQLQQLQMRDGCKLCVYPPLNLTN